MARVYVRSITCSTMLAGISVWEMSSVACGISSIKIDYSDYRKRFNQQNKLSLCFFNKILL